MKIAKCVKCNAKPDTMQALRLTVIKCFRCGAAQSSIRGRREAIKMWNADNGPKHAVEEIR